MFKILTICSAIHVNDFAPKKGDLGGIDGERDAACGGGDLSRPVCSVNEKFRARFRGTARAESLLWGRDVR